MTGLNVLFEVLSTMALIMSPFTPFFSEYMYQHLRQLMPLFGNEDPAVAVDVVGKAASVHFVMLPLVDESRLNARAEARFKTLQQAVVLARVARERRHIRNNLPLKNVVVVAANAEDAEALTYLRGYFMSEVNAWDVTISTEWEKLCTLSVSPNWKDLGKRLGKQMKVVAKAIAELNQEQILALMSAGSLTVCGFELTVEDLRVKREFKGDVTRFEACVSEDGCLLVAIDTTCDEEVLQELRARTLAAAVQRLRKSSGLVVGDKVEIFYEEHSSSSSSSSGGGAGSVAAALLKHAVTTVKRVKTLPLPASLQPKHCLVVASELVTDPELSSKPMRLSLTRPSLAVDADAVAALLSSARASAAASPAALVALVETATMYLQTMDYDRVVALETVRVVVDSTTLELLRGVHYFPSALERVWSTSSTEEFKASHSFIPSAQDLL